MLLNEADALPSLSAKHQLHRAVVAARFHLRRRDYRTSYGLLAEFADVDSTSPGLGVARLVDRAYHSIASGSPDAAAEANAAYQAARDQRAHRSRRTAELLLALGSSNEELSRAIVTIGRPFPWHLSYLADLLVRRAHEIDPPALETVEQAVHLHPFGGEALSECSWTSQRTHSARNRPLARDGRRRLGRASTPNR